MINALRWATLSLLLAAAFGARADQQSAAAPQAALQRITLAQIFVTRDVKRNLERIREAFAQAKQEQAQWVFFPEGALSGYYDGFDQEQVATAFAEVQALCRQTKLYALLGTCWKQDGKTSNEIRILDDDGELVGRYAKRCLTYGDAKQFVEGRRRSYTRCAG